MCSGYELLWTVYGTFLSLVNKGQPVKNNLFTSNIYYLWKGIEFEGVISDTSTCTCRHVKLMLENARKREALKKSFHSFFTLQAFSHIWWLVEIDVYFFFNFRILFWSITVKMGCFMRKKSRNSVTLDR